MRSGNVVNGDQQRGRGPAKGSEVVSVDMENVVALVSSSVAVVERYEYTPYGQMTIYNPDWSPKTVQSSAYGNTILNKGMSLDATTGLYYDRARWYDPGTDTFITRDPARADANLYRFCGDNPVNYIDPTGMKMSWSAKHVWLLGRGLGRAPHALSPCRITCQAVPRRFGSCPALRSRCCPAAAIQLPNPDALRPRIVAVWYRQYGGDLQRRSGVYLRQRLGRVRLRQPRKHGNIRDARRGVSVWY